MILELVLSIIALGLGFGLCFLKFIPSRVKAVVDLIATFVLAVIVWGMFGLPAVELLEKFVSNALVLAITIPFLLGERIGELFN